MDKDKIKKFFSILFFTFIALVAPETNLFAQNFPQENIIRFVDTGTEPQIKDAGLGVLNLISGSARIGQVGVGLPSPTAPFEIDSGSYLDPSGLRFFNFAQNRLNVDSLSSIGRNGKALTVDALGNVVLANFTFTAPRVASLNFSGNPLTFILNSGGNIASAGLKTNLTWTSIGTDTCSASGDWSGEKPTGGTEQIGITKALNNFVLTCQNSEGSNVSRSVSVGVAFIDPPPVCSPSVSCGGWSACNGSTRSRQCTRLNSNCTTSVSSETSSCVSTCTPQNPIPGSCGAWSSCVNGTKTRTCQVRNSDCSVRQSAQQEGCTNPPADVCQGIPPTEVNCSAWGQCIGGARSRTCDIQNCLGVVTSRGVSRVESCTSEIFASINTSSGGCSSGQKTVNVTWNGTGASGLEYQPQVSTDGGSSWSNMFASTWTTATEKQDTISVGQSHQYRMRARISGDSTSTSSWSNIVTSQATPGECGPTISAPNIFQVQPICLDQTRSLGALRPRWDWDSSAFTPPPPKEQLHFYLYKCSGSVCNAEQSAGGTLVGSLPFHVLDFTDNRITLNDFYNYKVRVGVPGGTYVTGYSARTGNAVGRVSSQNCSI